MGLTANDPLANQTSTNKMPALKHNIRKRAGAESPGAPRASARKKANKTSATTGRKSAVEKTATQQDDSGEGSDGSYKPSPISTRLRRSKQKCVGETKSQASEKPANTAARKAPAQSVQRAGAGKTTRKPAGKKMSAGLAYTVATRSSTAREAAMGPGKGGDNDLFKGKVVSVYSTFDIHSGKCD